MTDLDVLDVARNAPVLRHLPLGALDRLVSQSAVRDFDEGRLLLEEGTPGRGVFLLLSGRVAVRAALTAQETGQIANRDPGDLVGEMSLVDDLPRSASVAATVATRALWIPTEAFLESVSAHPAALLDWVQTVTQRLRESDAAQLEQLKSKSERLAVSNRRLARENRRLRYSLGERSGFESFAGSSEAAERVREAARRAAESDLSVLLLGETGTGKEVIARAIHASGERARGSFVALNCALFNESLLESELFGHARGAFTGAHASRAGLVETAGGGTLLLDEVADMPPSTQAALLRFLELGEYRRLGETTTRHSDVRVIAATHIDLDHALASGQLRRDLFYRLDVFRISIPPLRERSGDIPELAARLAGEIAERLHCEPLVLAPDALEVLVRYRYPGNVRELRNEIERLYALVGGGSRIRRAHVAARLAGPGPAERASYAGAVRAFKRELLRGALERSGGNRARAAASLGLHRSNFSRMVRQLEVVEPDPAP